MVTKQPCRWVLHNWRLCCSSKGTAYEQPPYTPSVMKKFYDDFEQTSDEEAIALLRGLDIPGYFNGAGRGLLHLVRREVDGQAGPAGDV